MQRQGARVKGVLLAQDSEADDNRLFRPIPYHPLHHDAKKNDHAITITSFTTGRVSNGSATPVTVRPSDRSDMPAYTSPVSRVAKRWSPPRDIEVALILAAMLLAFLAISAPFMICYLVKRKERHGQGKAKDEEVQEMNTVSATESSRATHGGPQVELRA